MKVSPGFSPWSVLALLLVALLGLTGCETENSGNETTDDSAAQAATVATIVGQWTLNIDSPRGVLHPVLTVQKTAEGYSATYEGRQGLLTIDRVEVDGAKFSFPLSITIPIGTIEVNYVGVVQGDKLQGVVRNPRGEVPFSAERTG